MEEEVRSILRSALGVNDNDSENLAESIGKLFKPLGGIELKLPKRGPMREPPTFEKKPKRNRK